MDYDLACIFIHVLSNILSVNSVNDVLVEEITGSNKRMEIKYLLYHVIVKTLLKQILGCSFTILFSN